VVECSEEPQLHVTELEPLAEALVVAQKDELERFRSLAGDLSETFRTGYVRPLLTPILTQWAEEQQKTLRTLQQSLIAPTRFSDQLKASFGADFQDYANLLR
jgi:hypothetical protein